ncbi:hypothetical protein AB0G94_32275, partial [Streptomyces griseofuscus]
RYGDPEPRPLGPRRYGDPEPRPLGPRRYGDPVARARAAALRVPVAGAVDARAPAPRPGRSGTGSAALR